MSGKWEKPGVPHKGWCCVDANDNGFGSSFICEMCEVQEIRFLHTMRHPDYPGELVCGCICAGHMEGDYAAATERERVLRLTAAQRDRWAYRRGWKRSAKGNPYLRYDRFVIVVYPLPAGGFGFLIRDRVRDREVLRSRKPLPDQGAAMTRTFDAVQWLKRTAVMP